MDEGFEKIPLRERLLLAGIDEIATHGVLDFSLRRVAAACGTSCAAPYRHFENKEVFLLEIVRYINRQWGLLRDEILRLFAGDARRRLIEVSVAYVRFSVANPHYRLIPDTEGERRAPWPREVAEEYCAACGIGEAEAISLYYRLPALLYGTATMLLDGGLSNTPATWEEIRRAIETLLP